MAKKRKYKCAGCGGVSEWTKGWRYYYGLPNLYSCSVSCEDKVFSVGVDSFLALAKKVANIDNKRL